MMPRNQINSFPSIGTDDSYKPQKNNSNQAGKISKPLHATHKSVFPIVYGEIPMRIQPLNPNLDIR